MITSCSGEIAFLCRVGGVSAHASADDTLFMGGDFMNVNSIGRHHTYNTTDGQVELQEVGPRFELKLYDIKLGSVDEASALDSEWSLKPFMNTTRKRLFLGEPSELAEDA